MTEPVTIVTILHDIRDIPIFNYWIERLPQQQYKTIVIVDSSQIDNKCSLYCDTICSIQSKGLICADNFKRQLAQSIIDTPYVVYMDMLDCADNETWRNIQNNVLTGQCVYISSCWTYDITQKEYQYQTDVVAPYMLAVPTSLCSVVTEHPYVEWFHYCSLRPIVTDVGFVHVFSTGAKRKRFYPDLNKTMLRFLIPDKSLVDLYLAQYE